MKQHAESNTDWRAARAEARADVLRDELRDARADAEFTKTRASGLAEALAVVGAAHAQVAHDATHERARLNEDILRAFEQKREAQERAVKAEAELRTILERAGAASNAVRSSDSEGVIFTSPLDAVATLEVYARNLKTRAEKAEAELLDLRDRLKHAEHERDNWKHSWEELARAQLQRQKRKARR